MIEPASGGPKPQTTTSGPTSGPNKSWYWRARAWSATSKVAWRCHLTKPDYIQDKIDFHLQRQRHAREAPPDCGCLFCKTSAEIEAMIRERIRLERMLIGEPPF